MRSEGNQVFFFSIYNFTFLKKNLFIYLAAPGLSCGTWDLRCCVRDLLVAACGVFSCGM